MAFGDAIRELNLTTCPRFNVLQMLEDARSQNIASHYRQGRRGLFRAGLFDNGIHFLDVSLEIGHANNTVLFGLAARYVLHSQHRALVPLEHVHHLFHDGCFSVKQVVSQYNGKWLILQNRPCAQHGMAQPQRFCLADVDAVNVFWHNFAHNAQQILFALGFQCRFQFEGLVKVICNRTLVTSGNEYHIGYTRCYGFFHRILNQWFIYHRQHFLSRGLGCW